VSATVCSNCGAKDSIYQEVTVESDASRGVSATIEDGKVKAEYGPVDEVAAGMGEVTGYGDFGCSECSKAWSSLEEAVGVETREWRCTGCDWWCFNDWQHAIERPDCDGEIIPASGVGAHQEALV
jgi:hypothetical protein